MALYLTTTATVTINDLFDENGNPYVFTHPTTNFILTDIWLPDEILASIGLQAAMTAGTVLISNSPTGAPILDLGVAVSIGAGGAGGGGSVRLTRTVSASTTISDTDDIIEFAGGPNQTLTLPDPSTAIGKEITIKNSSLNPINVDSALGTIDAYSVVTVISTEQPSVSFVSDGSKWLSIDFSGYDTGSNGTTLAPYHNNTLTGSDLVASGDKFFIEDTTRGNKNLSIEQTILTFDRNSVNTNTWLKMAGGSSDDGFVMPYTGTIVASTLTCGDAKGKTRNFSIYVNTTEYTSINTISGLGLQTDANSAVNIDFAAGDVIRFRGRGPDSKVNDVTAVIWVKWRI